MPKFAPPPPLTDETWHALLALAAELAALKPWTFAHESDLVGLIDPVTGETRIGSVLGNGGEVFAAVFYRRGGLRWILQMVSEEPDPESVDMVEGMDCLKLELVPKKELWKEDVARHNAAGFKPPGKGSVWPQFRASEPGWHPWHVTQTEAEQFLADLPRLLAFCHFFRQHPDLYESRAMTEIPFLPAKLPARPLTLEDLEWHPVLLPPVTPRSFQPSPEEMDRLRKLPRLPGAVFEFDSTLLPGASLIEEGRPCFGRLSLLAETSRGLIMGTEFHSAATAAIDAAGRGLVKGLLNAGVRPEKLRVSRSQLQPMLEPLCAALKIKLQPASSLPSLDEAMDALTQRFAGGMI